MFAEKFFLVIASISVVGCNGAVEAAFNSDGEAVVTLAGHEWRIQGGCESEGEDLTFIAAGDPTLSIGVNTAKPPSAIGNFSSKSEGFGILIGNPDVPTPNVEVTENAFIVSGTFLSLDGSKLEGKVGVNCK